MSKAFDTVLRGKCLEILIDHLDEDEHRMVKYHIALAKTCAKIGNHCGKTLKTNVGVLQENSLFPILFVFYLFKATETLREELTFKNTYEITYADDQNFYSRDEGAINYIQNKIENSYAKFRQI